MRCHSGALADEATDLGFEGVVGATAEGPGTMGAVFCAFRLGAILMINRSSLLFALGIRGERAGVISFETVYAGQELFEFEVPRTTGQKAPSIATKEGPMVVGRLRGACATTPLHMDDGVAESFQLTRPPDAPRLNGVPQLTEAHDVECALSILPPAQPLYGH